MGNQCRDDGGKTEDKKGEVDDGDEEIPSSISEAASPSVLGIRPAPIRVPLHRRLETFAAFVWMSLFFLCNIGPSVLFVYLLFYTRYWYLTLLYLVWYVSDQHTCSTGGRRGWVRRWALWRHLGNFFPVRIVRVAPLTADRNYIMGYHPHGMLSAGAFCCYATDHATNWAELFPGLTPYLLTLDLFHRMPGAREMVLSCGACSASRASMDHLLGEGVTGRALCLVPGGAPEAVDAHPGMATLYIKKRKGFAKMALRHGASLVPMFGFGENELYAQVANPPGSWVRAVEEFFMKYTGIPSLVFTGRGFFQYSFGIVPRRRPITVVVGAPIHVPRVPEPSSEEVLDLHQRYMDALTELYDTHKHTYARDPSIPLKFV